MSKTITLDAATAEDEEFLYSVYSSTRAREVAAFGWGEVQAEAFLRMQFTMRQRSYKMQFPEADHSIIIFGQSPAGRLIVDRTDRSISLTDIAVLPEYRGHGIATHLIRQLQDEAAARGKPLVLCVDKTNTAAKALYEKLGFTVRSESDLVEEMKWEPAAS